MGKPPNQLRSQPSRLAYIKDIAGLIQTVLTITALIVAAVWFFMRSEATPKANITHTVKHEKITEDWTWVHVGVIIANPGLRRLELRHGTFRIQGIIPLGDVIKDKIKRGEVLIDKKDGIVQWPTIGKIYVSGEQKPEVICENEYENREINVNIDPGESQKLVVEYLIPSFIKAVRVYSYVSRDLSPWEKLKSAYGLADGKNYGWYQISIYDLKQSQ
jgi:hypothetical protein